MRYGSCSSPATVNYETRDGDAEAGADYVAIAGTLTFEPGEDKKQVRVCGIKRDGMGYKMLNTSFGQLIMSLCSRLPLYIDIVCLLD